MSWWREASIYQVYPRSFQDSNGDGEGDLKGVISRLPYLKELGIDAVWLSPFYTSPNRDGGYDVSNPRDVDPRFGSIADAENLIHESHNLGLRVIVDIVPNHFSTEHEWFKEALISPAGSPARGRFHFLDGRGTNGENPPNNWCSIFGGSAWTRITEPDGNPGQWYLHLFDSTQADLNWDNSDVYQDFERTIKFWLDKGVDGFRIDVAHGLVKDQIDKDHRDPEGLTRALRLDVSDMAKEEREALLVDVPFFDREGVHEIYRKWRKIIDSYPGERMTVAEAWVHPSSRAARYVRNDELHQIFNFDFLIAQWDGKFLHEAIEKTLLEVAAVNAPATWVLCNHDSPRLVTRLGGGALGKEKARALALLTHALPGSVYVYQGEELGLEDAFLPDSARQDPVFFRTRGMDKGRDAARVPIPWNSSQLNYGFSSGKPWLPMPNDWHELSVDFQQRIQANNDANKTISHLQLYQLALKKRKEFLGKDFRWAVKSDKLIVFLRGNEHLVVSNLNSSNTTLDVREILINHVAQDVDQSSRDWGIELMLSSKTPVQISGSKVTMPANSTAWFMLKGTSTNTH